MAERPYYLDKPYRASAETNLSQYDKRAKDFEIALAQAESGEIPISKLALRLKEKGGMMCGSSWSGLMVGTSPGNCPPGWLFLEIGSPETVIQAALVAIKEPVAK